MKNDVKKTGIQIKLTKDLPINSPTKTKSFDFFLKKNYTNLKLQSVYKVSKIDFILKSSITKYYNLANYLLMIYKQ